MGSSGERTELDIQRLLSSYPLLLDSGDIAGCVALFTDDCEFVFRGETVTGHEALHQFFQSAVDRGRVGIHLPGPTRIDVEPDASSASTWQSFIFVANGENDLTRGMYRDRAVLTDDGWRLQRRDVELYPAPA